MAIFYFAFQTVIKMKDRNLQTTLIIFKDMQPYNRRISISLTHPPSHAPVTLLSQVSGRVGTKAHYTCSISSVHLCSLLS